MAGPTTTSMVRGLGTRLPLGMARSEPAMPIGTMGAPVRADKKVAPSISSRTSGPSRLVPSGNMTSSSRRIRTSSARLSASRSADSRCTGNAPTLSRSRPRALFFHISSLVMKKSLRLVQKAANPKSAKERCTGARMAGPEVGTCSFPDDPRAEPRPEGRHEDGALGPVEGGPARIDLERLVPARRGGRGFVLARHRRTRVVHSHDSTSSTTSCTVRPVVSSRWASSASRNGEASRVESIRSRRATPSGASSSRRRARSSGEAVR